LSPTRAWICPYIRKPRHNKKWQENRRTALATSLKSRCLSPHRDYIHVCSFGGSKHNRKDRGQKEGREKKKKKKKEKKKKKNKKKTERAHL
jgi:hypothetical protein